MRPRRLAPPSEEDDETPERREDELGAALQAERREAEEGGGRAEGVEPPAGVEPHLRGEPLDLAAEAQLPGERHVVDVAREEVVVEALEGLAADGEGPDEAPRLRVLLEHDDGEPRGEEPVGRHEAREAAADDGDPPRRRGGRRRGSGHFPIVERRGLRRNPREGRVSRSAVLPSPGFVSIVSAILLAVLLAGLWAAGTAVLLRVGRGDGDRSRIC